MARYFRDIFRIYPRKVQISCLREKSNPQAQFKILPLRKPLITPTIITPSRIHTFLITIMRPQLTLVHILTPPTNQIQLIPLPTDTFIATHRIHTFMLTQIITSETFIYILARVFVAFSWSITWLALASITKICVLAESIWAALVGEVWVGAFVDVG